MFFLETNVGQFDKSSSRARPPLSGVHCLSMIVSPGVVDAFMVRSVCPIFPFENSRPRGGSPYALLVR